MYAVTLRGQDTKRNQARRSRVAVRVDVTARHRMSSRVRRRWTSLLMFATFVVIALLSWLPSMQASGPDQIVTVHQGDTLWSISQGVAKPSEDVRDVIVRIEDANHLADDVVSPGMRLHIPR